MIRFFLILFAMFLLLMFLMGFSIVRTFRNILSGNTKKTSSQQHRRSDNRQQTHTRREPAQPSRKKIFAKDDGEYVDYEEVKK
ncbi:hypothetical protein Barb6_03213 [Bacteroidales bacterium Barb6]|nr:hypothetical protein Barb6_03213 [Bacteroidales bacterium Barb6]